MRPLDTSVGSIGIDGGFGSSAGGGLGGLSTGGFWGPSISKANLHSPKSSVFLLLSPEGAGIFGGPLEDATLLPSAVPALESSHGVVSLNVVAGFLFCVIRKSFSQDTEDEDSEDSYCF